jgi:hypothetical protein
LSTKIGWHLSRAINPGLINRWPVMSFRFLQVRKTLKGLVGVCLDQFEQASPTGNG